MKTRAPRNGYAMLVVLVFIALLMSMGTVSHRQLSSVHRVERARENLRIRDEGSIYALALAMELLKTGLPPSSPYVCGVTLDTSDGSRAFTVTFTDVGGGTWDVVGRPTLTSEAPIARLLSPCELGPILSLIMPSFWA